MHKLDALTRILEVENFDGMLVFAAHQAIHGRARRPADRARLCRAALNGDLQQAQRERTIAQLKSGAVDILVATDVAARGLDVDRISHVVNSTCRTTPILRAPHRPHRPGRAQRRGHPVHRPRERNMLRIIERATRQPIEAMNLPPSMM